MRLPVSTGLCGCSVAGFSVCLLVCLPAGLSACLYVKQSIDLSVLPARRVTRAAWPVGSGTAHPNPMGLAC